MSNLEVISIETPNLGDRSYVIGAGATAIVIDPQRDIDRVLDVLDAQGWSPSHILETHFHNDYVSGGLQLARLTDASYVVPDGMDISFAAQQVKDNDEIESVVGRIRVLHTPGHTPNHVSFAIHRDGHDIALFTGGSLLFGSVGRPDLLGPAFTEPLARSQWKSMQRLPQIVSNDVPVYPTHGFGSFCSATATVGTHSTLLEQMRANPVFHTDEETYIRELIAGLDAFPKYYVYMGPANQLGAGPIDLSLPRLATADDLVHHLQQGDWVVDLRHRRVFAADHIHASFSFDVHGNAVTYLGWLLDWGTPLVLLGADLTEIAIMQRELVRIGIDRPVAYSIGSPADWSSTLAPRTSYPCVTHQDLKAAMDADPALLILDLRRNSEWENGFIREARHVPLHALRDNIADLATWSKEAEKPIWVYCGSGLRAAMGASILQAANVDVVHVDDDFPLAAAAGILIDIPNHTERLGLSYTD